MKDRGSWEENKTICSYQLKLKQIYHSIMGFSIGQDTLQYKHFQNAKTITQITHTQHSLRTSKVMDLGREQNFAFRMLFQQTEKKPNNKNPNEKLFHNSVLKNLKIVAEQTTSDIRLSSLLDTLYVQIGRLRNLCLTIKWRRHHLYHKVTVKII